MENEKTLVTLLKTADGREVNLTEFLATHPAFVIGTDARAGLRLIGVGIEPAHAVVTRRDTNYFISPRIPAARVIVNGEPVISPTRLDAGDILQLGAVSLHVAQSENIASTANTGTALLPAAVMGQSVAAITNTPRDGLVLGANAATIKSLDQPRQIYFPKQETVRGMSLSALISSIVTVLIVAVVIGYGLVTSSPATANDLTSQFAYKDGHVTVVMFDADW